MNVSARWAKLKLICINRMGARLVQVFSYNDEGDPVRVAKDKFIYNTVNLGLDIVANKNKSAESAS